MPRLIECLRKLEAMPKSDVATEHCLEMVREMVARRKANPLPGDIPSK